MKTLWKTTSRAALLAIAVAGPVVAPVTAVAQDSSTGQTTGDSEMTAPESGGSGMGGDSMSGDGMSSDGMSSGGSDAEMAQDSQEQTKPVEGQITVQEDGTVLADDLIGASVYNGSDENVGDINDLIISLDGNVEGVVIGVGGFLGIGEKLVAVEMSSLELVNDEDGSPRLVSSATKADLEAAPEFVTAEEQAQDAEQMEMQSGSGSSGSGMGSATGSSSSSGME